ncbi:MAG: ATPase, partial [Gammaproteobacteria bacterium]|nr:ATPase [Gammaproteobacteria bacterium]
VAAALVGRSIRARDEGNGPEVYGKALDYAGRFTQKEMGIMLVSDLHRAVGQELFSIPEFSPWAQDVAKVMLY